MENLQPGPIFFGFSPVVQKVSTCGDDRVFSGGVHGDFFAAGVVDDCFDRSKDDPKTQTFGDFFRRTHCLLRSIHTKNIVVIIR